MLFCANFTEKIILSICIVYKARILKKILSQKPSDVADKPLLPVMFFIHGGAFYMGTYLGMGPKELLEKDVVLVEIQYRLGPLGFMCLDHDDAAGNMGMLDQVLSALLKH